MNMEFVWFEFSLFACEKKCKLNCVGKKMFIICSNNKYSMPKKRRSRKKSSIRKKMKQNECIQNELEKGTIRLYIYPDCIHCKKQLSSINVIKSSKVSVNVIKEIVKDYKGIIDCTDNYCRGINVIPTWVIAGKKYEGKQNKSFIYNKIKNKIKSKRKSTRIRHKSKRRSFGSNYELYQQPQPIGYTIWGDPSVYSCNNNNSGHKDLFASNIPNHFGHKHKRKNKRSRRKYGGLLKRPYGPRDQIDMTGLHLTSKKHPLPPTPYGPNAYNSFGSTPGTPGYMYNSNYEPQPVGLYVKPSGKMKTGANVKVNLPLQYKDNQLNKPATMAFGRMPPLKNISGPNMVAYEHPYNMYNGAGSNTVNWATRKTYLPKGKKMTGVGRTFSNPRGWLAGSGVDGDLNVKNRVLIENGSMQFGNLVFDPQPLQADAEVIYQPTPPYMGDVKIKSPFVASYGNRKNRGNKRSRKKKSKQNRSFGNTGKTITLEKNGKISISS